MLGWKGSAPEPTQSQQRQRLPCFLRPSPSVYDNGTLLGTTGRPQLMSDSIAFLNGFAELVWSLVKRPDEVEAQKAALRRATIAGRGQSHRVAATEVSARLSGSGRHAATGPETPWYNTLALQMGGHSVSGIDFEGHVTAADLLAVARALAADPVRGDDGAAFDAMMVTLATSSVNATLGPTGFVRNGTPPTGIRALGVPPARTPARGVEAVAARPVLPVEDFNGDFSPAPEKRRDDSRTMIESALMRHSHSRSLDDLFIRLRGPLTRRTRHHSSKNCVALQKTTPPRGSGSACSTSSSA